MILAQMFIVVLMGNGFVEADFLMEKASRDIDPYKDLNLCPDGARTITEQNAERDLLGVICILKKGGQFYYKMSEVNKRG